MKEKISKRDFEKQKRIENVEKLREKFLMQGYSEYIGVMSIIKINIMVFVTAGPFVLIAYLIYLNVWGDMIFEIDLLTYLILLVSIVISIPVHEFIHGFTWHFFCKEKWKSIRFFVIWEYLTPCCHCKEPLKYSNYILGGLMPFLVLGIGITAIGIATHSALILLIGAINILAAGGDTTITCMSLKYSNCFMIDHPTECGFIAFRK